MVLTASTRGWQPSDSMHSAYSWLAAGVAVMSLCSLSGWVLGVPILTTFVPDRPAMVPMTAISMLIAAWALASIENTRMARNLASLQILIGSIIVVAHFADLRPWQEAAPTTWSSRMTGFALMLSGTATLLLAFGRRWQGQLFAFLTMLIAALIGMTHVFPRADLYRYLPGTGVSIPTIAAFLMLCAGQLLCFVESGITAALTPRNIVGGIGLRLILGGLSIPLILCGIVIAGYRQRMFDGESAVILTSWGAMALLIAALWRLAIAVDREERARKQLEGQRRTVQQMVMAALTHDARSPLQEATIHTAQLLKSNNSTSFRETIFRLQQSHRRIDRLLHSLLDSVTLDVGHDLALQRSRCELNALVQHVVRENEARLHDRVRIEGLDVEGFWDQDALFRVVENLLLNALKYGAKNSAIECRIDCTDARASLTVTNRGSPIPREQWEVIFQLFDRGSEAVDSANLGWGVGLAYARAVVARHGGTLDVQSSDHTGTTFAMDIPRSAPPEPASQGHL